MYSFSLEGKQHTSNLKELWVNVEVNLSTCAGTVFKNFLKTVRGMLSMQGMAKLHKISPSRAILYLKSDKQDFLKTHLHTFHYSADWLRSKSPSQWWLQTSFGIIIRKIESRLVLTNSVSQGEMGKETKKIIGLSGLVYCSLPSFSI